MVHDKHIDVFSRFCAGVISTLVGSSEQFGGDAAFCFPRTVTKGLTGLRCLLHYMENHPELLHLPFKKLALDAMREDPRPALSDLGPLSQQRDRDKHCYECQHCESEESPVGDKPSL